MVSNATLRANARQQLGGRIFADLWLSMVVVSLVYGAIVGTASSFLIVGGIILAGPMLYGLTRIAVGVVEGKKPDVVGLFDGFKEDASGTILLGLMTGIFVFLWSLLFVVPGIVKSYSYALAPYIQQEERKDWRYCLDKSRAMMNGYKWQLFCLDLSFIGWYIVGALCLGIGVLFVEPYHQVARANFYEAVKAEIYPSNEE